MKVCNKCNKEKELSCYSTYHNGVGSGVRHSCKECRNEKLRGTRKESSKAYYENNLESIKTRNKSYYESNKDTIKPQTNSYYRENAARIKLNRAAIKYGITVEEVQEIRSKPCEVCGSDGEVGKGIHIDHCHTTGKVRGGLCHSCNIALGLLKDDPELIGKLKEYIIASK